MGSIGEYLIGVIAAAVLCGIVTMMTNSKGTVSLALRLVSGLLMLLVVVRPWMSISLNGFIGLTDKITSDGTDIMQSGQMMAENAYRVSIIQQTQAYIEDEAKKLGCDLTVEVFLSEESIPVQVKLSGNLSPFARRTLSNLLSERLGIKQEDQIWI